MYNAIKLRDTMLAMEERLNKFIEEGAGRKNELLRRK